MIIRGLNISEDTDENKSISKNTRLLVVKLQKEINDLVEELIKNNKNENEIDYSLIYYLKKFENENYSLLSSYDFDIQKVTSEGLKYYEIVVTEK